MENKRTKTFWMWVSGLREYLENKITKRTNNYPISTCWKILGDLYTMQLQPIIIMGWFRLSLIANALLKKLRINYIHEKPCTSFWRAYLQNAESALVNLQNAECALVNLQNADFSVCQNAHMPKRGLSKECLFDTLSVSHWVSQSLSQSVIKKKKTPSGRWTRYAALLELSSSLCHTHTHIFSLSLSLSLSLFLKHTRPNIETNRAPCSLTTKWTHCSSEKWSHTEKHMHICTIYKDKRKPHKSFLETLVAPATMEKYTTSSGHTGIILQGIVSV